MGKLLQKEIEMKERRQKIEAQEVKQEEERKKKQQKLEQEKIEKQMKLEKKKEQEEQKKSDKKQKRKEREKIAETTIRIIDYPEPAKEDLDKTPAKENVNPLLADFADSVSSDILKEAKDNNPESVEELGAF